MSLRYRYRLAATGRMIHSLGGRTVRPRPVVPVTVTAPARSISRPALLDTGADDTILPETWARLLGLDIANAPLGSATIANAGTVKFRLAQVSLRSTDGNELREWPAMVGFTSARLPYAVLGFAGCLQCFTATFRGDVEEVELAVNALYPGT